MQFIVIAHDAKDEEAMNRRMAVREQHLEFAEEMFKQGKWLFASALLDEEGKMNGSVIACEFESEDELRKQWLDNEAYFIGDVWGNITIRKAKFAKHD